MHGDVNGTVYTSSYSDGIYRKVRFFLQNLQRN